LDGEKVTVEPQELEAQQKALEQRLQREQRTVQEYCRQIGVTPQQLRSLWALQCRWQRYVQRVGTPERLQAYYQAHQQQFERSSARVSHILLRCDAQAGPQHRQRLRQRLETLREQIAAGQLDFATAARRYSHCPSAAYGGDLGTVYRHSLPPDEPWLQQAFTLPVATLSPVIESEVGFHLLLVHQRTLRPAPPLHQCLPEVLDAFGEDLRRQTVQQLRRHAHISILGNDKNP
jgi:hypothetical protein